MAWSRRREAAASPQTAQTAIEVTGEEITFIDRLMRHVRDLQERGRPDMSPRYFCDEERKQLVLNLYQRAGAAQACEHTVAPLAASEIDILVKVCDDIDYFGRYVRERSYVGRSAAIDPMATQARDMLAVLHVRLGRARATRTAGGVLVFRELSQ